MTRREFVKRAGLWVPVAYRLFMVALLMAGSLWLLPTDPSAPVRNPDGSYTMRFRALPQRQNVGVLRATDSSYFPASTDDDSETRACGATYPPTYRAVDTSSVYPQVFKSKSWLNSSSCPEAYDITGYRENNFLLRFDTSGLPDGAVVSAATLTIYVQDTGDADTRNLVGEWYDGSNWPIGEADHSASVGSTAINTALSTVTAYSSNVFTLATPNTVSKTAYTGFRLGVSGGEPAGINFVTFNSSDTGGTSSDPFLSVTYTVSETPGSRRRISLTL
jgi:hypothetical protein